MMDSKDSVEITRNDGAAVVAFQTACLSDTDAIASVSSQIKQFIDSNHPKHMVFDFEKVKFFSSQVLGLILETRARLQADSGRVVISSINPQLHRVFRITNLDRIFEFFPDRSAAIHATPAL
ncbi:STAS domain-containing protein [Planctomycetota bacterium]